MATSMTPAPSCRSRSASAESGSGSTPTSANSAAFPTATRRPSTVPVTPFPRTASKSLASARAMPRAAAASTSAAASGCSLARSRLPASRSNSFSAISPRAVTCVSFGLPSVRVPVLSTTRVSSFSISSSASALRTSTPAWAPRPVPTMIDIGVASPNAQGQAMISTATALTSPKPIAGGGPHNDQAMKANTATASTAGTNQPDTTSASRWIGARERCAAATIATMRASTVSLPTRSARITKLPVVLTVAPVTLSPGAFSAGSGSPVSIDSSTALRPSKTLPSTGTFSPGRTRSRWPGRTASSGMSASLPSSWIIRACFGARSSRARIAPPVCARARNSSIWPSNTSVTMTAAASKYSGTPPCGSRNEAGNIPGISAATRL